MDNKQVSFKAEAAQPAAEEKKQVLQTARYDRKAMRARLAIDDYIDEELPELCGKEDIDECPNLDVEALLKTPADKREAKLKRELEGAVINRDKLGPFCTELLDKATYFETQFGGKLEAGTKKDRPSL